MPQSEEASTLSFYHHEPAYYLYHFLPDFLNSLPNHLYRLAHIVSPTTVWFAGFGLRLFPLNCVSANEDGNISPQGPVGLGSLFGLWNSRDEAVPMMFS